MWGVELKFLDTICMTGCPNEFAFENAGRLGGGEGPVGFPTKGTSPIWLLACGLGNICLPGRGVELGTSKWKGGL